MFVNYKIFHSRIVRKILTISILKRTLYVATALKMHIFILLLKLSSCISHVQVLSVRNKQLGFATFPSACLFRDTNVRRNRSPPFSRPLRPPPRRSLSRGPRVSSRPPLCVFPLFVHVVMSDTRVIISTFFKRPFHAARMSLLPGPFI